MKGPFFIAFAFLFCVCLVQAESLIPGKQYKYRFGTKVATSIPGVQHRWAGLGIKAWLVLQPRFTHIVCRLDDIKVERINEQVLNFMARRPEYWQQYDYSHNLSKPFKIVYEDGIVRRLYVQRNETEWSINIKKSIANMLNINLKQENSLQISTYRGQYKPNSDYFQVMEESMVGECETSYRISPELYKSNKTRNLFRVQKSVNFENCKERVAYDYSSTNGFPCRECPEGGTNNTGLKNYATHFYKLRGNKNQFLIQVAAGSSKHVYSPFTTNGKSIVAFGSCRMALKKIEDVGKPQIILGSDLKKVDRLTYTIPGRIYFNDLVNLRNAHHVYTRYGHQTVRVEPTLRLLNVLLKDYRNMTMEKAMELNNTAKFVEIVRQVSTFDYDKVEDLYAKFVKLDIDYRLGKPSAARELFWDMLAEVGTNPAIVYGLNLIRKGEGFQKSHDFLRKIPSVVKEPTEILLEDLYGLCSHHATRRCIHLRRACYLAVAVYIGQHCHAVPNGDYQPTFKSVNTTAERSQCRPELKTKYFREFSKHFNESHDVQNQTLLVLSLGQIRDARVVNLVKPIIQGATNHSLHVRVQAAWSLFALVSSIPEQVMEVMMPTVMNRTEDHEMRIAAFTVTIGAKPPLHTIYSLVNLLRYNRDENVNNYIYTAMSYLSNSTLPCHRGIAENVRSALETLKATNISRSLNPKYSWKFLDSGINEKYSLGGYTDITYIANNVSYVPRSLHVKFGDYFLGERINVFQFGFRGQGLDKIVDKIFGPNGIFTTAKTSLDILSREKRAANFAKKELKEIKELLSITPREYESIICQFYIVSYGQPMLLMFNETDFRRFLETGKIALPDMFQYLKRGISFTSQRYQIVTERITEVPTVVGLPILLESIVSTYSSLHMANFTFGVDPAIFPDDRYYRRPKELKLETHGRLSTDVRQITTFSVLSPFDSIKHGTGYEHRQQVSLPLNGSVKYNFNLKKISFDYLPVKGNFYHAHFEPFTFIDSYDNSVSLSAEKSYTVVGIHKFKHQTNESYLHDYLGVGVNVSKVYYGFYGSPWAFSDFIQKNNLRNLYYYIREKPEFVPFSVNFSITNSTKNPATKISTSFRLRTYDLASTNAYVPHYAKEDNDFNTFASGKSSRRPVTSSVTANFQAHGPVERKIDAEFVYQETADSRLLRYAVGAELTPPIANSTSQQKFCLQYRLRKPEVDWKKVQQLDLVNLNVNVKEDLTVDWGLNCESDKTLRVSSVLSRTEEQVELLKAIPKYKSHYDSFTYPYYEAFPHPADLGYNPYVDQYYRCMHDRKQGRYESDTCYWYIHTVTQLRKLNSKITYNNLPEYVTNATMKALSRVNHGLYPHVDYYFSDKFNRPDSQIEVILNVSTFYPVYDAQIRLPRGNIHYDRVYEEDFYPLATLYPYSTDGVGYEEHYFTNWMEKHYSRCSMDSMVRTFDNTTYRAPITNCYHIFAKDCSPAELFTVMVANSTDKVHEKAMKIIMYDVVIDFVPVSSAIRVRKDGSSLKLRRQEPYYGYRQVGIRKELIYIIIIADGMYVVKAPKLGLSIYYSGSTVSATLSNVYRGKQCGLCGSMNGRKDQTELLGPHMCAYSDTTNFTYSYAIPTSQCKVPPFTKPQACDRSPFHSNLTEVGCTLKRNQMVNPSSSKVCFSTKPVVECDTKCKATRVVPVTVPFHCLNAQDTFTKKLVNLRPLRVLSELANKSPDTEREIKIPERCIPN